MATYTTNYNLKKPDSSDPFGDFRGDYNDNLDIIDANLGGGGGGGHTIVDADGNSLPQEDKLQFTGAVSVTDDNVNGRTVVNVSGGSNLILDAQIYSTEEKQIGVWTDKKPLYRKTIFNVAPNTVLMSNVDTFVNAEVKYEGLSPDDDYKGFGDGFTTKSAFTFTETGGVITFVPWSSSTDCTKKTADYITIYYTKTTDTAGSGGYEAYGFSPVIYSEVERVIGVWRDNKPLYQKTIRFTSSSGTGWTDYAHGISDIDTAVGVIGYVKDVGGSIYTDGSTGDIGFALGTTYVSFYTSSGYFSSKDVFATVQYTKTTDVAGSGDYNTYGVPTVHIDTTEEVIGTFLGKPLYQRLFEFGSAVTVSNTNWTDSPINISSNDIKEVINAVGYTANKKAHWNVDVSVEVSAYVSLLTGRNGDTISVKSLLMQYTKTTD